MGDANRAGAGQAAGCDFGEGREFGAAGVEQAGAGLALPGGIDELRQVGGRVLRLGGDGAEKQERGEQASHDILEGRQGEACGRQGPRRWAAARVTGLPERGSCRPRQAAAVFGGRSGRAGTRLETGAVGPVSFTEEKSGVTSGAGNAGRE